MGLWQDVAAAASSGADLSRGDLALKVADHISQAVSGVDVNVYLVDEMAGTVVLFDGNEE